MSIARPSRYRAGAALLALSTLLAGCASIPTSGPTARQVVKGTEAGNNELGMRLVDVDSSVVTRLGEADRRKEAGTQTLAALARPGANDVVGLGDTLAISVYEVGVGLFGGQRTLTDAFDPSARGQDFPVVKVDRDGAIKLPFVGRLVVVGKTPEEIQTMIERAYHGQSQNPQAMVVVKQNLSETVFVTGDVRRPGRIELSLQNERVLDAIAAAGGAVTQTQDMVVRFSRGGRAIEERLDRIRAGAGDDLVLVAGDRIELIREPQTFTSFGAAGRVAQVPFDQTYLTLAEAVARIGGPSDAAANPKSIFLFRYEGDSPATAQPVIYRLNMMKPANYLLAQRFQMRDKDVIYVSNAAINRTAKFVSIINQLFSPFVTARAVAQ